MNQIRLFNTIMKRNNKLLYKNIIFRNQFSIYYQTRNIQLPSYHPKYKRPEWAFDLDLDTKQYKGFWRVFPVPPKARTACIIFGVVVFMEWAAFVICHQMMLAD